MNIESSESAKQAVLLRHENEELRAKVGGVMEALSALRESTDGIGAAFEGSPDAIVIVKSFTDDRGRATHWVIEKANSTACRLAGIGGDAPYGLRITEFFSGIAAEELHRLLASAERAEGRVSFELDFREPMNNWLGASAWAMPFKTGVVLVLHDATAMRVAVERRQQSEALFELLTQNATEMISSHRPDGAYLYVSPAFTVLLGYIPADIIGRSPYEFIHPDDHAQVREHHISLLTHAEHTKLVYRFRRQSGEYAWLESVCRVARHPTTGVIVEIQVGSRDVTEKVLIDDLMRGSQYRARAIFEHSGIGIATADMNGDVLDANPAFLKMMGYTLDEICSLKIKDLTYPDDFAAGQARFARAIREKQFDEGFHYEKRYVRKNGQVFWARVTATFVADESGRPQFNMAMVQDITETRAADLKLRGVLNELDHRVKNNLASIKALAEQTLKRSDSLEEFGRSFLGRLSAMSFVHEALSRKQWVDVQMVELARVVTNGLEPQLQDRVTISGPSAFIPAGAPQALGLVLHELATNAVSVGSLSNDKGRVEFSWNIPASGLLRIKWLEIDGPPIVEAVERGMGMGLIEGLVTYEIGGTVQFDFRPEGLRCEITIPVP